MITNAQRHLSPLPAPQDDDDKSHWIAAVSTAVAEATRDSVMQLAHSPEQARLFKLGLADMRLAHSEGRLLTSAHIVAALLLDRRAPSELIGPVGALATLFETGIDIVDNIADRELLPHWAAVPVGAATLCGTLFVSGLPIAMIATLPLPDDRRIRMLATIGRLSTAIANGQQTDYEMSGADTVSLDTIEESYRQKTGGRHALLVRPALEAAGETHANTLTAAEAFGRHLGLSQQIRSDIGHLFGSDALRDIRNGTRTWPIAFALQSADGETRRSLVSALDPQVQSVQPLIDWITERGVLVTAMLRAEMEAAKARSVMSAFLQTTEAAALLEAATSPS